MGESMSNVKKRIKTLYFWLIQCLYIIPKSKKHDRLEKKEIVDIPSSAVRVDATITPALYNKKGVITIISDDGVYQTGKQLKRLSECYKFPITVAGTVRNIALYRKWWKKAVENRFFEVVNHSYNHVIMSEESAVATDLKKLIHEIVHSRKYFNRVFSTDDALFVCPDNTMCNNGYKILHQDGVTAVARGTRGINSLDVQEGMEPGQWYNLMRVGVMDKNTLGGYERNRWVDEVEALGGWLIEMWHNVSEDKNSGYQTISPKEAEDHLKYILNKKNIWYALFSDVVKYVRERQNAELYSYIYDGFLFIFVDIGDLYLKGYNQELTVDVKLPGGSKYYNIKPNRLTKIDIGEKK